MCTECRCDRCPYCRAGGGTPDRYHDALSPPMCRPANPVGGTRTGAHHPVPRCRHGDGHSPAGALHRLSPYRRDTAGCIPKPARRYHSGDRRSMAAQSIWCWLSAYRSQARPARVDGAAVAGSGHDRACAVDVSPRGCIDWSRSHPRCSLSCAWAPIHCATRCRCWLRPRTGTGTGSASPTRRGHSSAPTPEAGCFRRQADRPRSRRVAVVGHGRFMPAHLQRVHRRDDRHSQRRQ